MPSKNSSISLTYKSYEQSTAFSITAEESEKIEREYEIARMVYYINDAIVELGNSDISLQEAVTELKKRTRFINENY
jgi:phosphoribosyl-ATP pyrophosphohydrolase